jgi:hypothetical protein
MFNNSKYIIERYSAILLADVYQTNQPFPHIVLHDVLDSLVLDSLIKAFPAKDQLPWYTYDNPLEKKLAYDKIEQLPYIFQDILTDLNSAPFLKFLTQLTGIEGLISDPYLRGGGLHQIERGGKLDVHADFNVHPYLKLRRRINVLLFLNEDWKEEYGGHLELWDRSMTHAVERILPIANTMVIFNTTDGSFHGHPEPLMCPEGMTRKSLAWYYYTYKEASIEPHSTVYMKRPQDNDDLDKFREERSKGYKKPL